MNILITGGCGFVGSNLCLHLKKKLKKSKIFSLDNLFRKGSHLNLSRLKSNKIRNYEIDIKDYKKINNLKKFDLIIDCCAEPAINMSTEDPDRVISTNLIGTFNLLKKCKKDKAKIIFLSTSRVYSIIELNKLFYKQNFKSKIKIKYKINETFKTSSPKSLYGFTKLSSEELIKEFNYSSNIQYIINRLGVISGPWQFGKQDQGYISLWVNRFLTKKKLSYIGFGGYGQQIRDVIHIDDVSDIIYKQIVNFNKIKNETFNIGGGVKNSISLKELTRICEDITKSKIKFRKIKTTSIYDIPYYVSDNSKIKKFYNWAPKRNIYKIIRDIYIWMSENKNLIKKYF
jgi:CDP-paratose 2-epimerase